MTTRINPKELFSWLVLLLAFILFGTTLMYAQDAKSNSNSKVTIRINKEEDGKITKLDTTFDFSDENTIERLIEKFSSEEKGETVKHDKKARDRNIKIRAEVSSEKDGEVKEVEKEINISLSDLESQIRESLNGLKELHFDFSHDFPDSFAFDFQFPDDAFKAGFDDEQGFFFENDSVRWNAKCHQMKHVGIPDSLLTDEYIVIGADEDEPMPVFEKEIVNPDGTKSFIFKRMQSDSKINNKRKKSEIQGNDSETLPGLTDLQIFPNPSSGKITVSFSSKDNEKTDIVILDSNGSTKIQMIVKDEAGVFEKKFDLSKFGAGTYILKISRAGKSITKKLIVE